MVTPSDSEALQDFETQGKRFVIPSKDSAEEWHAWFVEKTGGEYEGLDFEDMQRNWGEQGYYLARIWLQSEYEEYCRGTNSIRMVAADARERDADLANRTLNRLVEEFVEIIIEAWGEPCFQTDPYNTHREVTRLKQISQLLRPSGNGLNKLLRPYARETIRAVLQSAKFRNKSQVAKFKGNEFIKKLGIRFSTITNYITLNLTEMYGSTDPYPRLCPDCANPYLDIPSQDIDEEWCIHCSNRIGCNLKPGQGGYIGNTEFVDEKLAYNFTQLLLEEQWLEVYPGSFDDLVTISGVSEDEVKSTKPYPSMLYLSSRFYNMIHEERDRPEYVNNIHAVFRWFSMDRDRWCYVEPEDHRWVELNISKPPEIVGPASDDQLFSHEFAMTRFHNQGEAKPRGYLTADGNQIPFALSKFRQEEFGGSGHRLLRLLISKQDEFESLGGAGRIKATPSKKNITALNNLQKTQWEINRDFLLSISTEVIGASDHLEKYVLKEHIILPNNKETLELWNETILSNYIPKIMRFSKNVFWHVWACDFRGRMSPRCMVLSPQASDMDRALLRFKEWKPLGERGWYWLRVHLYNLIAGKKIFGDKPNSKKLSFDLRAKWIEDHLSEYLKIAEDPILHQNEWQEAPRQKGESLQRLAAILEVGRVWNLHTKNKMEWSEITSGLPIQLDASNNGYQHISALLGNKELAEAVNVLPSPGSIDSDIPVQDLYLRVSDKARENWNANNSKLSKIFSSDKRFSEGRISMIFDRKFAKQITMTMAYGAIDVSGIYSGNKNKKPRFTKRFFVFAGETKSTTGVQKFHFNGNEFDDYEQFSEHILSEHPDAKKGWLIEPVFGSEIPPTPPQWARIKEGYGDPDIRAENHLRNLNSPKKRPGKPSNWESSWHPDSLLRQVFRENEFTSDEQQKIADSLSSDYKEAVEEVTNDAMGTSQTHLRAAVKNSKNNILFWDTPTGFRIRNFYPKFSNYVGWGADKGGTWSRYWGTKAAKNALIKSYVGIFNRIEELLGPGVADIDQLIRESFREKGGKYTELENIFLSLGISNSDLQEYIDNPWTRSQKEGESFLTRLDNEWLNERQDGRKLKLCLINYLSKNKLNPLVQKSMTNFDEWKEYKSLARLLLISISYNPGRLLPDVTEIKDGETKSANTLKTMQTKITPNYIHSMDAAHMAMVVNKMFSDHGIMDFWAVHDCFGVHPSDTDVLVKVVRETFHEIYSNRSLSDVEGGDFEDPVDAFDVNEILNSEYIIG